MVPERSEPRIMFGVVGEFSSADIGDDDVGDGRVDGNGTWRGRCVSVSRAMPSLAKSFRL